MNKELVGDLIYDLYYDADCLFSDVVNTVGDFTEKISTKTFLYRLNKMQDTLNKLKEEVSK